LGYYIRIPPGIQSFYPSGVVCFSLNGASAKGRETSLVKLQLLDALDSHVEGVVQGHAIGAVPPWHCDFTPSSPMRQSYARRKTIWLNKERFTPKLDLYRESCNWRRDLRDTFRQTRVSRSMDALSSWIAALIGEESKA
jgi:hypothetical protein